MNKKTANPETSPNVSSSVIKSKFSLPGSANMSILPPNVIQNICLKNSTKEVKSTVSTLQSVIENSTNSNTAKINKTDPRDDINNKSLGDASEVPNCNSNENKLISKVKHMKQINNQCPSVKKKGGKRKINNSISISTNQETSNGNLENSQTTSKDVPKPKTTDTKSEQSSSKKYIDKYVEKEQKICDEKCICKETKFDSITPTRKQKSIQKSHEVISNAFISDQNKANSSTSITSAVTRKSLPLNSSNISGTDSSIRNNKNCTTTVNNESSKSMNLKDGTNRSTDKNNKTSTRSMNTSMHEECNVETSLKLKSPKTCNNSEKDKSRSNSTPVTLATTVNEKNLSESNVTPVKRKRGRPRKVVASPSQEIPNVSIESVENLEVSEKMNDVSIAETVIRSKRHSEKLRNISNDDGLSDDSEEINIPTLITKRRRGRPAGVAAGKSGKRRGRPPSHPVDTEYVPKSRRATSKTEGENSKKEDLVICAKCEVEVLKKSWNVHNLHKHNDMSWIKGEEPMDFENDIKLWKKVLTTAIKKRRGQLICEKCRTQKRSVIGFLSHVQFCGKSEEERQSLMVTCPDCGAVMMPSSMEVHERSHKQVAQNKLIKQQGCTLEFERVRRKAAEKAVSKILEFTEQVAAPTGKKPQFNSSSLNSIIKKPETEKKIPSIWKSTWKKNLAMKKEISCHQTGCIYTCTSYEDMCKHFSTCNFTPEERYMCKICKYLSTTHEEMVQHVTEEHTTMEEIDKNSDFDESCPSSSDESDRKVRCSIKFVDKEQVTARLRLTEPYNPTLEWTMNLEKKNYELHLFDDYLPNLFTLLSNNDVSKYLPELEVSMRTKMESEEECDTKVSWKQWNRFEGGLDEDSLIFFTGGPVWALAWLPIPAPMYSKKPCEYIAVSTHPTMESEFTVGKSHSGHNMIQIWSVGSLDSESDDNKKELPVFSYAIVHNSATVWSLEWCPSGCYQDEYLGNYKKEDTKSSLKRMGMLAAACSDGIVRVYSLPFPKELEFKKTVDNDWPIYNTDPVLMLVVNTLMYDKNMQDWQCTKTSWTKEHGHNTIAAGFSNGYIGLWDLTVKSPLSMVKRQNTYFVNAFKHFYAHNMAVTTVALVPYNEARFLASGSVDKTYKFWDLEDTSICHSFTQKSAITDGVWMTHWPTMVVCFDDAFAYRHTSTNIISLREYDYKYLPLLGTNSPTYGLAVSDYANSIAHGSLAGEILTIFPHELIQGRDYSNLPRMRKLSSFVKIVDFEEKVDEKNNKKQKKITKEYHYLPETYNACRNRFGLIFCDNLKDTDRSVRKRSVPADKLATVQIEQYPFMSVNRISWNPNSWSYFWMLAGYQNGLTRLLNFKYMSIPNELERLLPKHANFMLSKAKSTVEKDCKHDES